MEELTPLELFIELDRLNIKRNELEDELIVTDLSIDFIEQLITKLN